MSLSLGRFSCLVAFHARLAACVIAGLLASGLPAEAGQWRSLGPNGVAYPQVIAVAPSDPSVLYVGTQGSGKLYKSTDGAQTWTRVGSSVGFDIRHIVVSPTDPMVVYAGSFEYGVYKSTDGGAHWSAKNSGLPDPNLFVSSLAMDPSNASVLYVAFGGVFGGLYKTTDGGTSWNQSQTGLPTQPINAIAVDPTNSSIVYANGNAGVFKSVDGGASWSDITNGLQVTGGYGTLAIDPAHPSTVYVGSFGIGMFKSIDSGVTWTAIITGLPDLDVVGATISPSNPAVLYAVTQFTIVETTDAGATWADVGNGLVQDAQFTAVAIDPTDPQVAYVGEQSQLFKTTNGGVSWVRSSNGLIDTPVSSIAVDPTGRLLAGGSLSSFFSSNDAGQTWASTLVPGNGFGIGSIALDPSDSLTIYVGIDQPLLTGVARSTDGGASWSGLASLAAGFNTQVLVDPSVSSTVYATGSSLQRSTDSGARWAAAAQGLNASTVTALAASPLSAGVVYAGTDAGVFKSSDSAGSWNSAISGLGSLDVRSLAIDPEDAATLYAGTAAGVFKSPDAAASWALASTGVTGTAVTSLAIDSRAGGVIYAGTDNGVFRSTDAGGTWTQIGTSDVVSLVSGLAVDPSQPGVVYAATDVGVEAYAPSCGDPGLVCAAIDASGGSLSTSSSDLMLQVPPNAVATETNFSIASGASQSAFGLGDMTGSLVSVFTLGPAGLTFVTPVTLTLAWQDVDSDGIVDGTTIPQDSLQVFQNGGVVAGTTTCAQQVCTSSACCDRVAHTWIVQVSHFSEYALAGSPICGAVNGARLGISKILPPAGDDKLAFSGTFDPGGLSPSRVDPMHWGVQVRLSESGVDALNALIPSGAYDRTTKTGWKANRASTAWKWTGPKTGGPGGLSGASVAFGPASKPPSVKFALKGAHGSYAVGTDVVPSISLPQSGQCFAGDFSAVGHFCILKGSSLKCR